MSRRTDNPQGEGPEVSERLKAERIQESLKAERIQEASVEGGNTTFRTGPAPPPRSVEDVRTRVGTALAYLELASQVLEELPAPETAFPLGDRALYRYLQAAEAAHAWLVGHEAGDSVDRPARGSALGDGQRIYEWSEEETERHFLGALRDWSERQ